MLRGFQQLLPPISNLYFERGTNDVPMKVSYNTPNGQYFGPLQALDLFFLLDQNTLIYAPMREIDP